MMNERWGGGPRARLRESYSAVEVMLSREGGLAPAKIEQIEQIQLG